MTTDGDTAAEADLKVKEKQTVEKRQEMLKSLQNQVDEVDRNVTDLAKSFDSLFDDLCKRSEELRQDIASRDQEKDEDGSQILTQTRENLSYLVQTAKTVAENKVQALWSLSKLIHFIHADSEEICTDRALETCKALDIDSYLKRDRPSCKKNGESLIELLEEQNKRLQEKYKLAREHVKIVSELQQMVNVDRDLLRERLKKLESKKKECDNDYFAMRMSTDVSDGDVDSGSYSYIRKDADGVSSSPTYRSDLTTRSTQTSIHDIKVFVESGVQKSDSEEMSSDEGEKQIIEELQSQIQGLQDKLSEKEEILKTVVCRDAYNVTMVHVITTRPHRIELELIQRLTGEMEQKSYGLNFKKSERPKDSLTILTCIREFKSRTWESILDSVTNQASDTSKLVLVVIYEDSDKKDLDRAIMRKCALLDKFTTISLERGRDFLYSNKKEIPNILRLIKEYGDRKREVFSCGNYKRSTSMYY